MECINKEQKDKLYSIVEEYLEKESDEEKKKIITFYKQGDFTITNEIDGSIDSFDLIKTFILIYVTLNDNGIFDVFVKNKMTLEDSLESLRNSLIVHTLQDLKDPRVEEIMNAN